MKPTRLTGIGIVLLATLSLGQTSWAERPNTGGQAEKAAQPKLPSTPGEHLSAAKAYRDQAARERGVAEMHRFMMQRRKETPGQLAPSDWYYEHCQKLANAAEDLAKTAAELAEYHEKQAQELQKKSAR
jgi:hypothetical protein